MRLLDKLKRKVKIIISFLKKLFLIIFMSFVGTTNAYEIGKGEAICSNLQFVTTTESSSEIHPIALTGNPDAQCMMAMFYYGGYGGVKQNYFDSLSWFYMAAQGDLAIAKIHYINVYEYLLDNNLISLNKKELYTERGKWSTMMREVSESPLSSADEKRLAKFHWDGLNLSIYLPVEYK